MQRGFQSMARVVGSGNPGSWACPGALPFRAWDFPTKIEEFRRWRFSCREGILNEE
jgi:hypothetical protein